MNSSHWFGCIKGREPCTSFFRPWSTSWEDLWFNHDLEGLASFLNYMRGVESAAGMRPSIVMEATGHYLAPLFSFWMSTSI
ncbi:hypothetical protein QFZ81_005319 [Paenibacillus sp. V4I9]|nr:hypothetical protein [Paenibacillus sp. V4I9]